MASCDHLLLEIFSLLGEIYLVRTAYNSTEERIRRIDDCRRSTARYGRHKP